MSLLALGWRKGASGGTTLNAALAAPLLSFAYPAAYPPVLTGSVPGGVEASDLIQYQFGATREAMAAAAIVERSVDQTINHDLAARASGLTFLRGRLRRGSSHGPWSYVALHGDTVAPAITSGLTYSANEGAERAFALTFDRPVSIAVLGGAHSSFYSTQAGQGTSRNLIRFGLNVGASRPQEVIVRATGENGVFADFTLTDTVLALEDA